MNRAKDLFATFVTVILCIAVTIPALSGSVSASAPADGSLDTTFGSNRTGKVSTDIGRGGNDQAASVVVQPDGKIVAVGESTINNVRDFAVTRYNTNGSLDATFGTNGTVTTDIDNQDSPQLVALQANGKIIVAGISDSQGVSDFALVRYNSDGSLDTTFSGDGKVTTHTNSSDEAYAIAVQSDGKIIVTGTSNDDILVVRYNADGSVDTGFGTSGKTTTNVGVYDYGYAVTVQSNGKIVVVGNSYIDNQYDFTVVRYNQDGSLDTTFDTDGKVTTDISGGGNDLAYSVVVQSNGKIIVAGNSSSSNEQNDFAVVRYNQDGSLDTTFDTDGKVTTNIGTNSADNARSVAIQSGGKILVAGTSDNDFAVVRYNQDGSLDTTFDTDGKVTTNIATGDTWASVLALQTNGKIIVFGTAAINSRDDDFVVVRYNQDGSLDTSFGTGGKVTTNIGIRSSSDYANSVAVQADGKIVVVGNSDRGNSSDFAVVRYNQDGSLDTSFGLTGKVTTDIGTNSNEDCTSVAVQSDGKIVVAGTSLVGDSYDFAVVRYNQDGSLDTTFDTDGKVTTDIGTNSNDNALSVAIQSDGKIIVVGAADSNYQYDFAVVRYNTNGSLDTTFDGETGNNGNGKITTDIGTNSNEYARSVAVQSDGKIIVAGDSNAQTSSDFAVVRYNQDGSLDTTFDGETGNNGNGKITTDIGTNSIDSGYSVAVQSDGKIVVAGSSDTGNSSDFAVVRYNQDGSLDTTFDGETGNNANGKITTDISNWDYAYSVALLRDGKIILTGYSSSNDNETYDFVLVRYNQDGSLDTTFDGETGNNANGKIITDIGSNSTDIALSVAVQPDGKIVVVGMSLVDNSWDFVIVRYNATSPGILSPSTTTTTTTTSTTTTTAAPSTTTTTATTTTTTAAPTTTTTAAPTTTTTAAPTTTTTAAPTTATTTTAAPITTTTTARTAPAPSTITAAPSRATITALPLAMRPLVTNNSLTPGETLTVSYGGFTPGEFVQLVVASTPQVIGSGYANSLGVVTLTGSLPSDLNTGNHTLVVYAPISKKGFRQPILLGTSELPATGSTNQTHNLMIAMYLIALGAVLLLSRRRLHP